MTQTDSTRAEQRTEHPSWLLPPSPSKSALLGISLNELSYLGFDLVDRAAETVPAHRAQGLSVGARGWLRQRSERRKAGDFAAYDELRVSLVAAKPLEVRGLK